MKQYYLYIHKNGMYELENCIQADTEEQAKSKAEKMGYDMTEGNARLCEELM